MKQIDYKELNLNPTEIFSEGWPELVTGKNGDKINAMTISWGSIGSLWGHGCGMPVVTIYVRPQRFSKALLDKNDRFTICFMGKDRKKEAAYLGSHSGRDEDKIKMTGLSVTITENYSFINESEMVLVCRKLYRQTMTEDCFIDKSVVEDCYPKKDFHDLYIAKVEKVLIQD